MGGKERQYPEGPETVFKDGEERTSAKSADAYIVVPCNSAVWMSGGIHRQ